MTNPTPNLFKWGIWIIVLGVMAYVAMAWLDFNAIGFSALQWFKEVKGKNVDYSAFDHKAGTVITHESWSDLLQKHVTPTGTVNYQGFIADRKLLLQYLSLLSDNPPGGNWSDEEKIAYWINAYNAFTIMLIIDHYPISSIKKIAGIIPMVNSPWDIKFFRIGGVHFDLNTIEHDILRKDFDEPRIHFAVNCASVSCPNLRGEAYSADRLEEQLTDQTRSFINDPARNVLFGKTLRISRIFDWFQQDFTRNGRSVRQFINTYSNQPLAADQKINFMEYDWNLNDAK